VHGDRATTAVDDAKDSSSKIIVWRWSWSIGDPVHAVRPRKGTLEKYDLVFSTTTGTPLDSANVRRAFRRVVAAAGMDPKSWTSRELRHSFVSLLSSSGIPIEDIAHLVGHANTRVTELVYRKELRPVLTRGAFAMNALFPDDDSSRTLVSRLVSRSQTHKPEDLEHDDERPPD
jgi:hypothetical protein